MGRGLPGRLFAKPRDHRKTECRIADEHPGCDIEQIPEASESDHGSEELRHVCPAVREVTLWVPKTRSTAMTRPFAST